jgi:acid phosphatase
MHRFWRAWMLIATTLVILAGCSSAPGQGQTGSASDRSAQGVSGDGGAVPSRKVTKVLVFIEENHSMRQMQQGMPYTFHLAKKYGYATSYFAVSHPSLPNYIAIAGGQTYGITDDDSPGSHHLTGSSVFGQAIREGKTAGVYVDGMPHNCAVEDGGNDYAVKHNPWPYFVREERQCAANDVPVGRLTTAIAHGRLPNVGMVVPNRCHDAHDCSLAVADDWFKGYMTKIFAGPDWRSGHLAVVVTADEDDHSSNNKVLTVVIHPSQHGKVVKTRFDHYALTRLYEDVVGAPRLHQAASAASMAKAFGLPIG